MLAFLNIGAPELVVILFVAVLIFGNRLPAVMKSLGASVGEFKKGLNDDAPRA
jgi:sec-independent protein translocase protein TatA